MSGPPKRDLDHEILDAIAARWSPYVYDPSRGIGDDDLAALFEAARWAASSYNEQPWRFIVARREDADDFERMLSCLVPVNREWAQNAAVLVLTAVARTFERNQNPNRTAQHDLGLAVGNLVIEATSRGIAAHQMAGIDPDRARSAWGVPADFDVVTAIALGYPGDAAAAGELGERDRQARPRRRLAEFVFAGGWGRPAPFA